MAFIASYWMNSSSLTVSVYSNCEQVRLYMNATLIGTNSPITGTPHLEHPRFSFTVPSFQTGYLRAEGLIGGAVRAVDTVYTPGAAAKVSVVIDTARLPFAADGSDIAIVYASILDANGHIVPSATNSVNFTIVSGPGDFVGSNPKAAEAGIASILLRSRAAAGPIVVSASTGVLPAGSDTVISHAPPLSGTIGPFMPVKSGAPPSVPFTIKRKGTALSVQVPLTNKAGAVFTLCNAQGKVVGRWNLTKSITLVSVKPLPHGVYFGQIVGGANRYMQHVPW
jgi:hypothetical protein